MPLEPPFTYFGNKRSAAHIVWERFGNVEHYVEPFAGSLAVLLGRPAEHGRKLETVNDKDGFIVNFWRAVANEPEAVAFWADHPKAEADLTARSIYLVEWGDSGALEKMMGSEDFYDVKAAGYWLYVVVNSIDHKICRGPWVRSPETGKIVRGKPRSGVSKALPLLSTRVVKWTKKTHNSWVGENLFEMRASEYAISTLVALSERLRAVRIVNGDWSRVVTNAVLDHRWVSVGVFLDPPYDIGDASGVHDVCEDIAFDVAQWAVSKTGEENLRIAFCGYSNSKSASLLEDAGWTGVQWERKTCGASLTIQSPQFNRERIYFSPSCLKFGQTTLFDY